MTATRVADRFIANESSLLSSKKYAENGIKMFNIISSVSYIENCGE